MATAILEVARRAALFFRGQSPIHATMRRLAQTLDEMRIPFAIAGAMAANTHGHSRTTAGLNILIRRVDLDRFKTEHLGADG